MLPADVLDTAGFAQFGRKSCPTVEFALNAEIRESIEEPFCKIFIHNFICTKFFTVFVAKSPSGPPPPPPVCSNTPAVGGALVVVDGLFDWTVHPVPPWGTIATVGSWP